MLAAHACQGQTVAAPPDEVQAGKSEKKASSDYLRIVRNDDEEPIAMETSIVTFRSNDPAKRDIQVDLIGAVHVADKAYFKQLNQLFTQYEVVLYELVAPKESNVPTNGQSRHPIGQMQQGMKSILNLSFQLEEVDYTKENFVHADMSPEEFSRVMSERGESFFQMMLRMMGQAMVMQGKDNRGTDTDLLFALFAKDRSLRLKRIMSTQFEDLEATMGAIDGEGGSTLIGQRNKTALGVLRRELAAGKKKIGIFYGAGHNPDMEQRLIRDHDFHPDRESIRWLTAWNMRDK
jgi:hypothetical protein